MATCVLCRRAIAGPLLPDSAGGGELHPSCLAEQLPADLAAALLTSVALVAAPALAVWAS